MPGRVIDTWTPQGKKLMKELKELGDFEVRIGFQAGRETTEEGVDVVDIAAFNEFGTSKSPSRPFMRDSLDNHRSEIDRMMEAQGERLGSGTPARTILETIGLFGQDLMQTEIEQGEFERNAESTVKAKGSEKPLIDSGRLKNAVTFWIGRAGDLS